MELPVTGETRLEQNLVGSHFANYDSYIILSHFKGHAMAEAGKSVSDYLGNGERLYISVF